MNPLFLNPWFIVIAGALLLGSAGAGFFEGSSIAGDRWQHRLDALHQQAELVADAEAQKASEASTAYEQGRAKAKVKYVNISKEVDNVIEGSTTVYSRECFDDDGLRTANDALTRSQAPPSQSTDGVSGPYTSVGQTSGNGLAKDQRSQ